LYEHPKVAQKGKRYFIFGDSGMKDMGNREDEFDEVINIDNIRHVDSRVEAAA
jgi:hypothetical protein